MAAIPYIQELLDRMQSKEKLPVKPGEISKSSTHSISFMAHAEARKLSDTSLLPDLKSALKSLSPRPRYRNAIYALGHLAGNTGDQECIELLISQFQRKGIKNQEYEAIIGVAGQEQVRIPFEFIEHCLSIRNRDVLYESFEYCGSLKEQFSTRIICDLLEQDCYHIIDPMFAIIALDKIGDASAIPTLERTIERHKHGKKGENTDAVYFSQQAIERLSGQNQAGDGNSE